MNVRKVSGVANRDLSGYKKVVFFKIFTKGLG
jgi:hypothetical protein